MTYPYRIFIGYSREDLNAVKKIVQVLKELGHEPVWDQNIMPGEEFTNAIKNLIAHSHIFMPFLTENSHGNAWVNQEIGYAEGLNIPVLPLAMGYLPQGMIERYQAIEIKNDLSDLPEKVRTIDFDNIVSLQLNRPRIIKIATFSDERTTLVNDYTDIVLNFGSQAQKNNQDFNGLVRLKGVYSSLSIPDKDANNKIWKRYVGKASRSESYIPLIRKERVNIEKLARQYGLKLIIDPTFTFSKDRGTDATIVRLEILRNFLEKMPDDKVKVVISEEARKGNIMIGGDWFFAESINPGLKGYHQTIFNSFALEVIGEIEKFDKRFEELYNEKGLKENDSRRYTIDFLNNRIDELKKDRGAGVTHARWLSRLFGNKRLIIHTH